MSTVRGNGGRRCASYTRCTISSLAANQSLVPQRPVYVATLWVWMGMAHATWSYLADYDRHGTVIRRLELGQHRLRSQFDRFLLRSDVRFSRGVSKTYLFTVQIVTTIKRQQLRKTTDAAALHWLKWSCEAGGGSPDEARLEQTPYPFHTQLIWRYLGIK